MPEPTNNIGELTPISIEEVAKLAQLKPNGTDTTLKVSVDTPAKELENETQETPITEPNAEDKKDEIKVDAPKAEPKPKKKLRDVATSFFDKTESGKTVGEIKKDAELPQDVQAKLKKLDNPQVQAFLEAVESGKDIFSYLDEIRGLDVSKMTPAQVFEHDLKQNGASEEEIQDAMLEFSEKPLWKQKNETKELYKQYSEDKDQKLQQFRSKLKADSSQQAENFKRTQTAYESLVDSSVGQTILGVKIEPEIAQNLKTIFDKNPLISQKADGSLDETELLELVFFKKYKDLIFTTLENNYYAEGAESVLNDVEATKSSNSSHGKRSPDVPHKNLSGDEKEKEHLNKLKPIEYSDLVGR